MKSHPVFRYCIVIFLVFTGSICFATPTTPDSTRLEPSSTQHGVHTTSLSATLATPDGLDAFADSYLFPELEAEVAAMESAGMPAPPDPDNLSQFLIQIGNGKTTAAVKKAKEIVQKAIDIGNVVDGLTGGNLVKMPIYKTQMIGQTAVTIVFNSATIYPQYAVIQVYAKIELPHKDFDGQPVVLYFGAEEIFFSQEKGIIKGNLVLLADFAFKLGDENPRAGIWLSKAIKGNTLIAGGDTPDFPLDDEYEYTGTFIKFDCEGFKEMGVGGRVYFSREWVLPTDQYGVPLEISNDDKSETPRTWGEFQIIVQDWNDIMVGVSIADPFVLARWQEMSFQLRGAYLDLSSYRNPPDIPYPVEPNLWEGVYIDTVAITLPKPFKRVKTSFSQTGAPPSDNNYPLPETERIRISARHLLLDETGVSGNFVADGQVPLIGGAIMAGQWGWSLDNISVQLIQSDITAFAFSGQLGAPIFSKDGPLTYTGSLTFTPEHANDTYLFEIAGLAEDASIPVWNAFQLDYSEPGIGVTVNSAGEFDAYVLFGHLGCHLGTEKDFINSSTGSKIKLPGVVFTQFRISTTHPYISYGDMEIETGDGKVMDFPINLESYKMETDPNNPDQLNLEFVLELNLMSQAENGVEAKGRLLLTGDYKRDINGAKHWVYRNLELLDGSVRIQLPQIYAEGTICTFEDHDPYGDGFYAKVEARLIGDGLEASEDAGLFQIELMAIFGNFDGYRYFMVDGFAGGDAISVPLFGPFYLDGFGGGVFHNMRPTDYLEEGTEAPGEACESPTSTSGLVYTPDNQTRFGFNFATSITTTSNLMTGLLTCIVRFNQNMVLQNITFWGVADIMVSSKLSERLVPGLQEIQDKIEDCTIAPDILKQQNEEEANTNPQPGQNEPAPDNGIKAKVGISLDFSGPAMIFHAFADVAIHVYDKPGQVGGREILSGRGMLDILLGGDDWHFYLGGYYPNSGDAQIEVPNFFNVNDVIVLEPVNVTIDYKDFRVSAHAYFLTGTKIPGPPPPAPEVVKFFGPESNETNRHLLDCSPGSSAMGTGIAFGASAFFDFNKVKKGLFGSCFLGIKLNVRGGAGFDLALLKYDRDTECRFTHDSPHGLNGFRAGGRVFVFIDLEGKHVTCLPVPPLGIGVKVRFDVPNPSFFEILAIIRVGKEISFRLRLGDECGAPCVSEVPLD